RAGADSAVASRRRRACGGSENRRARDGGDIERGQRAVSPVRLRSGAWRRRRLVRDAVGAVRRRVPTRSVEGGGMMRVRRAGIVCCALIVFTPPAVAQVARSGNPILPGWHADPEAHVFDGKYWIFPTYS